MCEGRHLFTSPENCLYPDGSRPRVSGVLALKRMLGVDRQGGRGCKRLVMRVLRRLVTLRLMVRVVRLRLRLMKGRRSSSAVVWTLACLRDGTILRPRSWRLIVEMLTRGGMFPGWVACSGHLPDEGGVVLHGAALPHQELPPVLGAFLERDDGPRLTVLHQLMEGHLDTPYKIVSGVSVLIEDLEMEREVVVPVTEL